MVQVGRGFVELIQFWGFEFSGRSFARASLSYRCGYCVSRGSRVAWSRVAAWRGVRRLTAGGAWAARGALPRRRRDAVRRPRALAREILRKLSGHNLKWPLIGTELLHLLNEFRAISNGDQRDGRTYPLYLFKVFVRM